MKVTAGTQTLIAVPFCRDPTQPVVKLPPDEPAGKPPREVNRPAVYKKKSGYSPSYYQPPAPWTPRDDTNVLEDNVPKLRKTNLSRSMYGVDIPDMQNPIRELQSLAKSTNDVNDDDPPFNFQAMLKKTPRNRASMKRQGESDNAFSVRESPLRQAIPEAPLRQATPKRVSSGKKSPAPAPPRAMSRELVRKDSKDLIMSALKKKESANDLFSSNRHVTSPGRDNRVESERVQLAPGISVEGTVTDL